MLFVPRRSRNAPGGFVYHVFNRAVARHALFQKDGDYRAFTRSAEKEKEGRDPGTAGVIRTIVSNSCPLFLLDTDKIDDAVLAVRISMTFAR